MVVDATKITHLRIIHSSQNLSAVSWCNVYMAANSWDNKRIFCQVIVAFKIVFILLKDFFLL